MKNFKNLSTLIFDFGGVLINLDRQLCIHNFKQLGVQNIENLLDNYVQSGIFLQLEKGLISPEEFRNELRKLGSNELTDEQIDLAWHSFLLDIPAEKLEMLLELRKKFRIIMLSNTNQIHFEHCKQTHFAVNGGSLSDYFDKCYLSYEMGKAKPDAEIFEALLAAEQTVPEACLFLDDGPQNIEQAKQLGIQTYLVSAYENLSFLLKPETFE